MCTLATRVGLLKEKTKSDKIPNTKLKAEAINIFFSYCWP